MEKKAKKRELGRRWIIAGGLSIITGTFLLVFFPTLFRFILKKVSYAGNCMLDAKILSSLRFSS